MSSQPLAAPHALPKAPNLADAAIIASMKATLARAAEQAARADDVRRPAPHAPHALSPSHRPVAPSPPHLPRRTRAARTRPASATPTTATTTRRPPLPPPRRAPGSGSILASCAGWSSTRPSSGARHWSRASWPMLSGGGGRRYHRRGACAATWSCVVRRAPLLRAGGPRAGTGSGHHLPNCAGTSWRWVGTPPS